MAFTLSMLALSAEVEINVLEDLSCGMIGKKMSTINLVIVSVSHGL
jgi:hypothetical protein